MIKFKNEEKAYLEWHTQYDVGYTFNYFSRATPILNVLHKSTCSYLWRKRDENSRTVVEKWCSQSEHELSIYADNLLGENSWKRCSVCYQQPAETSIEPVKKNSSQFLQMDSSQFASPPLASQIEHADVIWVPGEPAVWVGSGEKEWKASVSAALNANLSATSPQWLDLEFRFTEDRLFKKDIDNLMTPVLEAARDSSWIKRGFAELGSITGRKTIVSDASLSGVLIRPSSTQPRIDPQLNGVCIETELADFKDESVKWTLYDRAYEMYCNCPGTRFVSGTPLGMDVRVTVNNAQRRKSIQALLKPCIDGVEPILGTPNDDTPVTRQELNRNLAPQDEMIINLDIHVRGGNRNFISVSIFGPLALPKLQ